MKFSLNTSSKFDNAQNDSGGHEYEAKNEYIMYFYLFAVGMKFYFWQTVNS